MDIGYPISDIQYRGGEIMCCETNYGRNFLTKEEKIEKLKGYKEWLDNESKGVEEAIEKIKGAS
ncbi:hypothetical protein KAI23_05430 [Candidatus Bathyarchaeota archaeon]|nr:hypothetical protein [Candidatus Bathyarchaeota archaeon]